MRPIAERFWSKVWITDTCWIWTGAMTAAGELGYGILKVDRSRRNVLAHRFAYELTHGPIPSGLMVCHTCDVRKCVRPDHLFLGTAKDNVRDAIAKTQLWGVARSGNPTFLNGRK
jgi:hypothetical protein